MNWIAAFVALWIIWHLYKPKPIAREEHREPPEFVSVGAGRWTRPPMDQAAARAQRQFDSSGIDEQL